MVFVWGTGLSTGKPGLSALLIGVFLIADAIVSFARRWLGYPIGVLISVVAIIFAFVELNTVGTEVVIISTVIGAAALALGAKATVSRHAISEENHPLNLPVFG